jgi:hypothetical protein
VPCSDITETIDLALDADDRLVRYALHKRTCGAEIGAAALLIDWLAGRRPADILALDGEALLSRYAPPESEELLYLKHLAAIQESLRVLTGACRGGPGDACAAVSVIQEADGLAFSALVSVNGDTDRIQPCGGCGSCGS